MTTRHTGAVATVLDPDVLLSAARAILGKDPVDHGPLPQMQIAVDHGVPAIINGEGGGAALDAEQPGSIPVTFQAGTGYRAVPIPLEVIADAWTDQTIDLADGIRTFGARLDSNHYEWWTRYDRDYDPQA